MHRGARTDWKRQRERVTVEHRTAVEDRLIVMEHDVAVSASFRRARDAHPDSLRRRLIINADLGGA